MSCEHPTLALQTSEPRGRAYGDRNIPRQLTMLATCEECGETVAVDYNIAFIDGDSA